MADWRTHIDGEPGETLDPAIKGTGITVEAVLRLLGDAGSLEGVRLRFPELGLDEIAACVAWAAELLRREKSSQRPDRDFLGNLSGAERDAFLSETRRRIQASRVDPKRTIPHDAVFAALHDDDVGNDE